MTETHERSRVLKTDSHFRIYRRKDGKSFRCSRRRASDDPPLRVALPRDGIPINPTV